MYPFKKLFRSHAKEDWIQENTILFSRAMKAVQYLGLLPYNWNVETQELEYSRSLSRFVVFVMQYLLYTTFEGFVVFKYLYFSFDKNASIKSKATLQYLAFAYMLSLTLHSVSMFIHGNLHNYINRLLHYVREDFQRLPDDGKKPQKVGALVKKIPQIAAIVTCLNIIGLFRRPESPQPFTSLLPDVEKTPKWELIPFALIHGYIWCNMWAIGLFYFATTVLYISVTLNALNRTRPKPYLSEQRYYKATRKLEVLQTNYNALFRWMWWCCEVILASIFVFGFCGSTWNEGALAARLLVVSTFMLGALLRIWKGLGSVFETSSKVHWEWCKRGGLPSLLFRKQLKTLRPIRVEVGGYFYVDAAMSLTLLSIITENTCSILLEA